MPEHLPGWLHSAGASLNRGRRALALREGLGTGGQCVVFALVVIALFSRCPGLFLHPQFYAEDGQIWFAQAYNDGWWRTLLLPQAGYLNLMPRLGAGLALLFPFRLAPFVMCTVGLLIQALPVPILLSARCHKWGSLFTRLGLVGIYLALFNKEIHVVLTNTQWHLAVAAALLALATSPQSWYARVFDGLVLLLTSLSGPFGVILAPMILVFWWLRRQRWSLATAALVAGCACLQMLMILHGGARGQNPLGAAPAPLLRMLGGDIVAGALIGGSAFPWRAPMVLIVLAAAVGLLVYLYCLWLASVEWKLFLLYCALLLAASLRSPLTAGDKPAWELLVYAVSARYWFLPMLAFTWSALWCARYGRHRLFRIAGTCVLLTMWFGIVRHWRYGGSTDDNFAVSVHRLHDAKPGDRLVLPIMPAGWQMTLVKKPELP